MLNALKAKKKLHQVFLFLIKEKPQEGEVVAVGAGKYLDNGNIIKPTVKAGDKVLFSKYAGTEVKIDGQDLLIMREDDILGIIG